MKSTNYQVNQWNTIAFIIQLETRKFNLTEGNTTIDMFSSRQKLMFTTNRDFLPIQGNKKNRYKIFVQLQI